MSEPQWKIKYRMLREREDFPEMLLEETEYLFEENEDIERLALAGGLAAYLYAQKRRRKTSDIDIITGDETLVRRLKRNGYHVYYNENLDKYSAVYVERPQSYTDIYIRRIGEYRIDSSDFENTRTFPGYSIRAVAPEILVAMKLVATLTSRRGRGKHLIDIYSIVLNPEVELNPQYLGSILKRKLPNNISYSSAILTLTNPNNSILKNNFRNKERRIIINELELLRDELN